MPKVKKENSEFKPVINMERDVFCKVIPTQDTLEENPPPAKLVLVFIKKYVIVN